MQLGADAVVVVAGCLMLLGGASTYYAYFLGRMAYHEGYRDGQRDRDAER